MQKKQEKTEKSSFSWVAATDQPIATAADVKKVFNFFPPATSSTETTNKPLNVFAGGASRQRRKKAAQPKLEAGSLEMSDAIKPGDPAPSTQPGITTDAFRVNRTNTPFALPMFKQMLESPWRDVEWTEERKTSLIKTISSYRPSSEVFIKLLC
ncbi:uncharacterized protein [Channa argus]|uniref:uncharacterized protein isoform X6 n=1 Tax=Channa argus TaxID=215402 RepID=UPI0035201D96